jgi:hypothetical protein
MTLIASSKARGMSSDRKAAAGVNENWRASRWEVFAGVLTGITRTKIPAGDGKDNVRVLITSEVFTDPVARPFS